MSAQGSNKAAVRRYFDEVWVEGNIEYVSELLTPGSLLADAVAANALTMRAAFSDIAVTIDDLIAEEDKVAARVTFTAIHSGPLFGFPPTGKSAVVSALYLFTFVDGRVRTMVCEAGTFELLIALGLLPVPEASSGA